MPALMSSGQSIRILLAGCAKYIVALITFREADHQCNGEPECQRETRLQRGKADSRLEKEPSKARAEQSADNSTSARGSRAARDPIRTSCSRQPRRPASAW